MSECRTPALGITKSDSLIAEGDGIAARFWRRGDRAGGAWRQADDGVSTGRAGEGTPMGVIRVSVVGGVLSHFPTIFRSRKL